MTAANVASDAIDERIERYIRAEVDRRLALRIEAVLARLEGPVPPTPPTTPAFDEPVRMTVPMTRKPVAKPALKAASKVRPAADPHPSSQKPAAIAETVRQVVALLEYEPRVLHSASDVREAVDCTEHQWRLVVEALRSHPSVRVTGTTAQTRYQWAGAGS